MFVPMLAHQKAKRYGMFLSKWWAQLDWCVVSISTYSHTDVRSTLLHSFSLSKIL
jgi:hypothetical protein